MQKYFDEGHELPLSQSEIANIQIEKSLSFQWRGNAAIVPSLTDFDYAVLSTNLSLPVPLTQASIIIYNI